MRPPPDGAELSAVFFLYGSDAQSRSGRDSCRIRTEYEFDVAPHVPIARLPPPHQEPDQHDVVAGLALVCQVIFEDDGDGPRNAADCQLLHVLLQPDLLIIRSLARDFDEAPRSTRLAAGVLRIPSRGAAALRAAALRGGVEDITLLSVGVNIERGAALGGAALVCAGGLQHFDGPRSDNSTRDLDEHANVGRA